MKNVVYNKSRRKPIQRLAPVSLKIENKRNTDCDGVFLFLLQKLISQKTTSSF